MKLFLADQKADLQRFIGDYKSVDLSFNSKERLKEKTSSVSVYTGTKLDLTKCNINFLFDYQIFPAKILTFASQWQQEQRRMEEGDVIVQQAYLPPLPLSTKCVFAVRILNKFASPSKVGFSYGTLRGHPETGISEFYFEQVNDKLNATIHTYSFPGLFISRIAAPVFTLPYQQFCTNKALSNMRERFIASNNEIEQ